MSENANPFEGMYDPEDDGPVAPPAPVVGGMPVAPPGTGGLPVMPVFSPETGGLPVTPVSNPVSGPVGVGGHANGEMPVRPRPPAQAPAPGLAPVPHPIPDASAITPDPVSLPSTPAAAPVAPAPTPIAVPVPVADTHEAKRNLNAPVMPNAASTPGVVVVQAGEADEKIVLDDLLMAMMEKGGSDLHLSVGSPPVIRVRGEMAAISGYGPLTPTMLQDTMYSVMTGKQRMTFEQKLELDFAYTVPGQARFRVNVMRQRGSVGAVMRSIPWEILSLEALNLPSIIGDFANLPRGFVLVTGPTGSGKSTTLAAIIDKANRSRSGHIITIEDPVEFLHQHRGCVVNQREVGDDTHSFKDALKHVLRQDPDIIMVGELRDLETISVALTAAETGHLVFATLHTQSAQETITRIIDVFPPEQQQQVRTQLAASLQGVVCQTLAKTADGKGRQAAVEIMVATTNVRAMIRDDKLQQIQGALQSGGKYGMQTLNQDLAAHAKSGRITYEMGLEKCSDKEDFITLTGGKENIERLAQQRTKQANAAGGMSSGFATHPNY